MKALISDIVKYSALYMNDSNANEERNTHKFHLELPEEKEIYRCLGTAQVIILTGEAGDGKSRMLKSLEKDAKRNGFKRIIDDFSQEPQDQKELLIHLIGDILEGKSSEKMMLGANIGLLVQNILRSGRLLFEDIRTSSKFKIFNFEQRNLAEDPNFFSEAILRFLGGEVPACEDSACPFHSACPFKTNIQALVKNVNVQENIRMICNAVYLMGAHITLREWFSLLASLVTGGYDCSDIKKESHVICYDDIAYYNIFDKSDGVVLDKIKPLDPAKTPTSNDGALYQSCERDLDKFIFKKRKMFFEKKGNTYETLPVPYLEDFHKLLRLLCDDKHAYDIAEPHSSIVKLKEGLVKLISPEKTDLEISFFDIPMPTHERIMTRFSIDFNEIPLVWRHPQWIPPHLETEESPVYSTSINSLCLSGYYDEDSYTLTIGYELFSQILLAGDNYFYPSSGNSLHKYGLFDFFRQILFVCPQYSNKVEIIFDDDVYCNFEMGYYSPSNKILGTQASKRVQLKKK